jgi:hypothetical protein
LPASSKTSATANIVGFSQATQGNLNVTTGDSDCLKISSNRFVFAVVVVSTIFNPFYFLLAIEPTGSHRSDTGSPFPPRPQKNPSGTVLLPRRIRRGAAICGKPDKRIFCAARAGS